MTGNDVAADGSITVWAITGHAAFGSMGASFTARGLRREAQRGHRLRRCPRSAALPVLQKRGMSAQRREPLRDVEERQERDESD